MNRFVRYLALSACVLMLLSLATDFAALHDIAADYVSAKVIVDETPWNMSKLPWWSSCPGEWRLAWGGLMLRTIGLAVVTVAGCSARPRATSPAAPG